MDKIAFKHKMIDRGLSYVGIAKHLGINEVTLYRKLNDQSEFTRLEIKRIADLMQLSMDDINAIFFNGKLA